MTSQIVDGREFLTSPKRREVLQRRVVRPGAGQTWMNCGNCGGLAFKPLVRPVPGGSARVADLVCDDGRGGGCLAVYKLDLSGCLEGGGNLTRGAANGGHN